MQRNAVKMDMGAELEALLTPRKKNNRSMGEHLLKGFFAARRVPQKNLAKAIGLQEAYLSMMFNGMMYIPEDIEEKLNELKGKILAWEAQTGKIFGAESR